MLGFSAWLETEGSHEVFTYVRGFLNLTIRASLPGSVVHPDMSVTVPDSNIGYINFSDSIVFYTIDDSRESLTTMLRVCGLFMNGLICGPSRMVRGGIAHGEFYADPQSNAYVGQALVDAYRLEGRQDWLACSLHPNITSRTEYNGILPQYPNYLVSPLVPLRESDDKPICINWADKVFFADVQFSALRGLDDCAKRARKALQQNDAEMEKLERRIKQTREFVLYYN